MKVMTILFSFRSKWVQTGRRWIRTEEAERVSNKEDSVQDTKEVALKARQQVTVKDRKPESGKGWSRHSRPQDSGRRQIYPKQDSNRL